MIKCNYVLKVEPHGPCAGTVKVLFVADGAYITEVKAERGSFECYLSLVSSTNLKPGSF